MSDAVFVLRVGAGLYMDSNGNIRSGPDTGLPLYSVRGGMPVNFGSISKAFDGFAKAMPDPKDPKSREKLGRLGVLDDTMKILDGVGTVASVIGKVVGFVGFAVDIAKVLGILRDGPSAVEQLIDKRFHELDERLKGMEIKWQAADLRDMREDVSRGLFKVDRYLEELRYGGINSANLQFKLQDVRNAHDEVANAVGRLLNPATWLSGFNRGDYDLVWPWIPWPELYRMPAGVKQPNVIGGENWARFYNHAEQIIDHRAMVPGATYVALSYLTMIKVISPEYRTTGEFDDYLLKFADALENLAELLRDAGVARTVHVDGNFGPLEAGEVTDPIFGEPKIGVNCFRYTVGAMDLRAHTDDYWDGLAQEILAKAPEPVPPWYATPLAQLPDRIGPMWMRWTPPAKLRRVVEPSTSRILYEITNIDECIAAANAQAERDYVDVLYASGYFNLVHLVATLRHMATEPDRSESVTGKVFAWHTKGKSTQVEVSTQVPLRPPIKATGTRHTQTTKVGLDIGTQPTGRQSAIEYKVLLRTVPSFAPPTHWIEPDYSKVQWSNYSESTVTELDGTKRKIMGLRLTTADALSEVELFRGFPEDNLRKESGTATLTAHTFDWWIPTIPLEGRQAWAEGTSRRLAGILGEPAAPGGPGAGSGGNGHLKIGTKADIVTGAGPVLAEAAGLVIDDVEPISTYAQHRDIKLTEGLRVQWELSWAGDRMGIRLSTREEDRNFVFFVVIAEKLGPSGQWLHTAFKVPVNNQMTLIPQAFFDAEKQTARRMGTMFAEVARRYSKSLKPGPKGPGPIEAVFHPARMSTLAGLESAYEIAASVAPDLVREVADQWELEDQTP